MKVYFQYQYKVKLFVLIIKFLKYKMAREFQFFYYVRELKVTYMVNYKFYSFLNAYKKLLKCIIWSCDIPF